jgi:ABC-type uncharacterized transport system substrate-binding protein
MMKREPKIIVFLRRDFTLHTGVSAALYREIFREWPYPLIPGVHVCAEANDAVIETQIKEVLTSEYDVAVTIGSLYSEMVAKRIREMKSSMKQLCLAVKEPQLIGLIDSLQKPGGNITAVVRDHAPITQMLELLLSVKETMKRVLIPYFPLGDSGRIHHDADVASAFLERQGMVVTRVPLYRYDDFAQTIIERLSEVDTVLLLEAGYLTDELLKLVAACCEQRVTCCVGDIDGVPAGAAIVFGQDMAPVGKAAHKQLLKVLSYDGPAGDLPVEIVPNGRRLFVNKAMAARQGLNPDSLPVFVLEHVEVIEEDDYEKDEAKN